MKRFLFEYPFKGETYGFEIIAADDAEAGERIKALPWAQYKGEIFARIPAAPVAWWQRLFFR